MRRTVAFLFLGETLLIPHLWPIAAVLARIDPALPIDLWVATSVHEALLARWIAAEGLAGSGLRIRRAPGFRSVADDGTGRNPPLPPKLPMLAALLPRLMRTSVVVCAEQTSLWLPALLPLRTRFLKTSHGVGSMSARDDRRRRAAWRLLVPSALEKATYAVRGFADTRVVVTGYVKASFARAQARALLFADDRPVVVYAPHWQRHRSSWWAWGRPIAAMLAQQRDFNVILAPHQRLVETDPGVRAVLAGLAQRPHVHADLDSFAMVDGSYTAAADVYLGDTSSQVVEFLADPRPCVFLNAQGLDWRATDDHDFWRCGEVIDRLEGVLPAIARARAAHGDYAAIQRVFAASALGDTSDAAPVRAAEAVLAALVR